MVGIVSQRRLPRTQTNGSVTEDNLHLNGFLPQFVLEFGDRYRLFLWPFSIYLSEFAFSDVAILVLRFLPLKTENNNCI